MLSATQCTIVLMIRGTIVWMRLFVYVAGCLVSIMGISLALEQPIVQFADRELRTVSDPLGAKSRSLREMFVTAAASTRSRPTTVTIRSESTATVEFGFGRDRILYVDPYTGAVLGEGSKPLRRFYAYFERWHLLPFTGAGANLPFPIATADLDKAASLAAARFPAWGTITLRVPAAGETEVDATVDE